MHYLIHTPTLTLASGPIGGHPAIRRRGTLPEINEGLPEDYAYVPGLPRPQIDRETQTLDGREVTEEGYGWRVRSLTTDEIVTLIDPQDTINALSAAFREQIPAELQTSPALLQVFAIVRVLIEAGEPLMAKAFILNAEVPEELEALKPAFAAMIPTE